MAKYRRMDSSMIVVEAAQWFPDRQVPGVNVDYRGNEATVPTLQGFMTVEPGDWVIAEPDGRHYCLCNNTIFHMAYEPAE